MRSYLVGLPVLIEVSETGTVTYRVDTSEAAVAIWEDDESGYTDEHREKDAQTIDADHMRRMRAWWPEWPTSDD